MAATIPIEMHPMDGTEHATEQMNHTAPPPRGRNISIEKNKERYFAKIAKEKTNF